VSEGSDDAAILIATSFQALRRAAQSNPDTLVTDCTILILFAGYYVEATLNHIFESTEKKKRIEAFPIHKAASHGKTNIGLRDKLAWFYNEFIETNPASNWREINRNGIDNKLEENFR